MDRYDELLAQVLNGPPEVERPKARRRRRRAAASRGGADEVDPKKRRLSEEQVELLELSFREERKLESGRKVQLAAELGLDPKQVAVWFQNRRARHKSKLLEEEFGRLKCAHDATVVHNCHLENEVLMLKERLMVAEEEVTKLKSAGAHAVCGGGSPRPSFSPDACMATDHAGGGGVPDDLMYVPDYGYDSSIMECCSLYGLM